VIKGKPVFNEDYQQVRLEIAFRPRDGHFEVADAAVRKNPEYIPSISETWAAGRSSYSVIDEFLQKLRASRTVTDDDKHAIVKTSSG